ncbi:MAG: hypothetical protein F4X32_01425 [Candidatus Dadabacteria bacterium]|nr:hypothetical protein [Candidatus Dadabacteria bacterium]
MIKIEREESPENTALDKEREKELRKIRKLAKSGKLKSKHFKSLWSDPKVKDFLYKSQHGKCCYCERKRDKRETDVEHFRPKAKVEGVKEDHQGYWWLAYSWQNLLIACKTCNQEYKKSKFPLKKEKKRAYTENSDLGEEEPLLINPLKEDPELCVDYDLKETRFMAKAIGKCERGEKTINELTGINDRRVMEERADKLKDYRGWAYLKNNGDEESRSEADERLREYISPYSEFSGFARFYFEKEGCL